MKKIFVGVITIIIGVAILIYSVSYYISMNNKKKNYIETVGYVVSYEECELDDTTGTRYIVEYKIDRNSYLLKSNSCSSTTKKLNSKVKIKYNPNNPEDAIFANDITHYLLPFCGAIFFACGILVLRKKD